MRKRELLNQAKVAKERRKERMQAKAMKEKEAALIKDKARAAQLRIEHPHIGIPDSLSKPALKNLLHQLKQKGLLKKAARQPEAAYLGGISLRNPILID